LIYSLVMSRVIFWTITVEFIMRSWSILPLVVLGCSGEKNITVSVTPPTVLIQDPAEGAEVQQGAIITMRGYIQDNTYNEQLNEMEVFWSVNGEPADCEESIPDLGGNVTCEHNFDDSGETTISLRVINPGAATGEATNNIQVISNIPPEAQIIKPDGLVNYYSDHLIDFEGLITDAETEVTEIEGFWVSSISGELDIPSQPNEEGIVSSQDFLPEGEHLITFTAVESETRTGDASISIIVGGNNNLPECQILTPEQGTTLSNNEILEMSGDAFDQDIPSSELRLSWTSNLDGLLSEGSVNSDGSFSVGVTGLTVGPHTITLTVEDEVGDACTDSVDVVVGAGPSVQIVVPNPNDFPENNNIPVFNSGARVDFQGLVSDNQDDPQDLILLWSSSIDGAFSTQTAASNGVAVAFSYGLTAGQSHVIEFMATDSDGFSSVDQITIEINDLPTAPSISLTPDPTTSSDDVSVVIDTPSTDAEGDTITYSYSWERNGLITTQTNSTVPYTETTRGEDWTVTVTPNDGMGDGDTSTATVSILNSAPLITASNLSHTTAYETDIITCTPAGAYDEDGDSISFTYDWQVNGVSVSSLDNIEGSLFDRSDTVQCFITPSDGYSNGIGTTVASSILTITNSTPVLSSANITPQTAYESTTLTCNHPNATDADPIDVAGLAYEYNWYVSGTALNLNQNTLDGSSFDKNQNVECTVTPSDGTPLTTGVGSGVGTTVSSQQITILNTPPVLGSADLSPDPAYESDILACVATANTYSDDDNDTITFTYDWIANNISLGINSSSLSGTDFNEGDEINCVITPEDGTDSGQSVSSNSVIIQNTAPTITQPSITPNPADVTSPLQCVPGTISDVDPADQSSLTIGYEWEINGTLSSTILDTLPSPEFSRGDTVTCITTPYDGTIYGTPVSSNPITIQNAIPSIAGVQLTPTTSYEADTVTCTPTGWYDPDGDAEGYIYSWTVGGNTLSSATTNTLTGSFFNKGDDISCTVTPDDSYDTGTPITSNTIIIQNTPPVLASVSLGPSPAYENSTLACSTGTTSDDDGDQVVFTQSSSYQWLVNGGAIAATTSTLNGTDFNKGDTVQCIVMPFDGTDFGSAVPSSTITIQNTAPTISGATLSPSGADVTDQLICSPGSTNDIDPVDTVTTTYEWTVNNVTSSVTTDTLSAPDFARSDVVRCIVTPTDGSTNGTPATSNSITIQNATPTISSVNLTPTTSYESSTLSCSPVNGSDPDGDTVSYLYSWYVNNNSISFASSSLTGSYFDKGDDVYCEATPTDGSTSGLTLQSNTVTIQNTPPVANTPSLSPTTAYETTTFTCTWNGGVDDDPVDSVSFSYGWKINGQVISSTTATLTGSSFNKGEAIICFVTPTDGFDNGTPVDSSSVIVSNSAPSIVDVTISPSTPFTDESIVPTIIGWQDDDGDAEGYIYQWYNQNGPISNGTNASLGSTATTKGDVIYLEVTPFDGTDSGASVTSNIASVQNTPPSAPVVEIQPIDAEPEDNLECIILTPSLDPDGDSITYTYEWYLGGVLNPNLTSSIVSNTMTIHNDIWTCTVTPNDGIVDGNAGSDSQTVADQTAPDAPVLDAIDQYTNRSTMTITGSAEPLALITLFLDCDTGLTTTTTQVSSTGVFSITINIASGDSCEYYAKATDSFGNISVSSNVLNSEYCSIVDTYEISALFNGNTCAAAIDDWIILSDTNISANTINVSGNVLDPADEDWYVIDTSQTSISSGINNYNFQVDISAGAGSYDMLVYRGDCTAGSLECSSSSGGYDTYDYYAEDDGANYFVPSDSRYCDNGTAYNNCDDLSDTYYIKVYRTDGTVNCQHYTLTISNGY
jgi:hypothetical protein